MIEKYFYILFVPILLIVNFLLIKKNILLNFTGQKHQVYTNKNKVPLSGGIILGIYFVFDHNNVDLNLIYFLLIFLIIGLLADLNIIKSPTFRFFIQIIFLVIFISHLDLYVYDIRINVLNLFLENYYFNIFFVLFCILVLLNGSNFIDGNNCLSIGYFLIIFLILEILISKNIIFYEYGTFQTILIILSILFIFNFNNKLYLGDGGVYLLSIFVCFNLITIYNFNNSISPYFIVNLLWYPAFEILFSLIRKTKNKLSPMSPDTMHLHQLIFYFFSKKLKVEKKFVNSLTGILINIYHIIIFYMCSINIYNTKIQILLLLLSVSSYLFIYMFFLRFKKSFKNKKFNH